VQFVGFKHVLIFISLLGEHKFLLVNLGLYHISRIILNSIVVYVVQQTEIIPNSMNQPISV